MQKNITAENEKFPVDFYDIGLRTFGWVYENKPEFVNFTLNKMSQTTGLYKVWQNYCINKQRIDARNKKKNTQT